ncbi:MAG: lasso RiPP family leader peptide-containing protein [Pseudonocardia sp.]|nr:lasso RiPP family leader peptide-containing protein [Pseudonocardia sp.]
MKLLVLRRDLMWHSFRLGLDVWKAVTRKEKVMIRNKQLPERYTPPAVTNVGHFSKDTNGTIHTKKDATTWGFKKEH